MPEMRLQPPHLTVAVYSGQSEVETFAQMYDIARELGCVPLNVVEVAPMECDFELLSDLGIASKTLKPDSTRLGQLIAGQDPALRVLRAGCSHRKFGKVIIEYQQKTGPGAHPIGVSVAADSLGIPEQLWSASQKRSAYAIAEWSRTLLETAVPRCAALYGAVGVEFSLPTPWQLSNGKPRLATELFVSRRLLDQDEAGERKLRQAFSGGEVVVWGEGVFFSGWAPYNSRRITVDDPTVVTDAAARVLRSSLS